MSTKTIYSIIESPLFPDLTDLCQSGQFKELRFDSTRKAISQLRKEIPDVVIGEFVYGYGNNYAGVNISNLDVFFYSLQKYAPRARIIVVVEKGEREYVDKLAELFELHTVLTLPADKAELVKSLE
ncbi:MAG: hypothetical protein OEY52_10845 [Gammaproteobacteria bacterium]|nr:hypothetical protein [Gammaproteobacteria bacterium]